jgi:hypothetical protein
MKSSPDVENIGQDCLFLITKVPKSAVGTLRFKDVLLPLARVKTIMKSSSDVENIGQESLFLITKVSQL